jgi:hypothetical protein
MFFFLQDNWQIIVGLALPLIGAAEVGYRIGDRNHAGITNRRARESPPWKQRCSVGRSGGASPTA